MKKRMVYVHHHRGLHSNGPHLLYFVMTMTAAALLAVAIIVMSIIIGMEFFNL